MSKFMARKSPRQSFVVLGKDLMKIMAMNLLTKGFSYWVKGFNSMNISRCSNDVKSYREEISSPKVFCIG